MPVPRPVLSRRTPGGAGGRGTTAVRALGADPPPPGGFPCTPLTGPPLPPPGPGRGPHRRSSLFRLRRFCSVHAIDTCMPAAHGEGAPRGREGRKPGSPRADKRGVVAGALRRAGRLRRLRRESAGRIGPAGAGCWRSRGLRWEERNAGDPRVEIFVYRGTGAGRGGEMNEGNGGGRSRRGGT